jgi:hypothetical protein
MKSSSLLCVVAMLAGAACGSVSSPKADANNGNSDMAVAAADFTIAAESAAVSQAIAGKLDVAINVTRGEGFTDPVALTVTGLPAGVTSAFSLNSVPDGTTSSTLSLTVNTAASVGTTDITVTGTAGSLVHTTVISLELKTSTVAGKIRGLNQANVTVRIVGKAAVMSDGSGNFSFTDVKVPYDIYVIGQTGTTTAAPIPAINYYKGLTRLDPVVTQPKQFFFGVTGLAGSSGRIDGAKSGAGNTTDPLYLSWSTGGSKSASGTPYFFNASWFPAAGTKAGTLGVLQVTNGGANGSPSAFNYKEVATTLTAGTVMNTNVVNVALETLNTASLTGTITQPGGFGVPTLTISQQIQGKTHEIWNAPTTSASSLIPLITGQKASFYAMSTVSGRKTEYVYPGLTASTDVSFTLPPPAGMTGPVNAATNITTTSPFDFTTTPNQVYLAEFDNGTATFFVYTTASSITIPNVSEMPLPTGASYTWTVFGYGPHADINAAADPVNLIGVGKAEYDGTPHFFTSNPTRTFTTQ